MVGNAAGNNVAVDANERNNDRRYSYMPNAACAQRFGMSVQIRRQLEQINAIRAFIESEFKMRQIIKKTKYNQVPNRNNEHREPGAAPYIVAKQEFGKIV